MKSRLCDEIRNIPGYDPYRDSRGYWFDEDAANSAISFAGDCLTHVDGIMACAPYVYQPHERAIVANLFGWKHKRTGLRRYRQCLYYVARGNSKSTLAACIANTVLFTDGENNAQCYSTAAEREQAAIVFDIARQQIEHEPILNNDVEIFKTNKVIRRRNGSRYKALSAEAGTKHGLSVYLAIHDEIHVHNNSDLLDAIHTGTLKRAQPLEIYLTTADYQRESPCNNIYDYACKVRDGILQQPEFLPVIYEVTRENADREVAPGVKFWETEDAWALANPMLKIIPSLLPYLKSESKRALDSPVFENTFKRLHLNIRTESDVRWLQSHHWDDCTDATADTAKQWHSAIIEAYRGRRAWAAIDLGSTSDLTAMVLLFPNAETGLESDGAAWVAVPYFWVPRDTMKKRSKTDRVPYDVWARDGYINVTDGNCTDYDVVRKDINDLANHFAIPELAIDRLFQGAQLSTQLMQDGFSVIAFGQGFFSMGAPTKALEELVIEHRIDHGCNPVLRWMANNVSIELDAAGTMKPSKKKSSEKIDGIVALIMAIGRAICAAETSSMLDETFEAWA